MRREQWRVLLPLGVAILLSLSGDLTLYAVLPAQALALGVSLGAVGLILSANRIVRLLSNPAVGLLLDRRARRPLFLYGMGLGTLSTLGYLTPARLWLFLPARLLWGISWSLIYIGAYSMVVDITGPVDRGRASGVLQAFFFAGLSLNPLLGGVLADRFGFRAAVLVCASLAGLGFLAALIALPETRRVRSQQPQGADPGLRLVTAHPAPRIGQALRQPRILTAYYLFLLATFAGDGLVMSTISLHLGNRYGEMVSLGRWSWPIATAGGALLALRALTSAVVAPLAGHLSDRAHDRWGAVAWGVLSGVAGMGLLALVHSPQLLALSVCLVALSGGVLYTVLPAVVGDLAVRDRSGTVMGGLMTAGDLGGAVAPLAAYGLLAVLPLAGTYLLCSLILLSGLGALWLAGRREAAATRRSGQG